MSGKSIKDTLIAARFRAARIESPYLARIIYSLVPIESPGLQKKAGGPIAVDRWHRLYFDPDQLGSLSAAQISPLIIHEAQHLLRRHSARFEGADPLLANLAGDMVINAALEQQGLRLPLPGIFPESFGFKRGKSEEEYYALLKQKAGQIEPRGWLSGSCAGGKAREWEAGPPNPEDPSSPPGIQPGESELIRRQALADAAKYQGHLPGDLRLLIDEISSPSISWAQLLRRAIRSAIEASRGNDDYSYSRLNRRSASHGIILPGQIKHQPRPAIILDTSGSMWNRNIMKAALGEIEGILRASLGQGSIPLYQVDAAVQLATRIKSIKNLKIKGGGGTDMRIGIEAAMKAKPVPTIIIVVTDGYTDWPAARPKAQVIVALTESSMAKKVPSWAKVILIGERK